MLPIVMATRRYGISGRSDCSSGPGQPARDARFDAASRAFCATYVVAFDKAQRSKTSDLPREMAERLEERDLLFAAALLTRITKLARSSA